MLKPVLKCLLALELLIAASQACATQDAAATLDPNAIKTAIAGTMAAAATQTAQSAPLMESTPTITPTKTLSPTPFPTFTLVVAQPRVYVTKSTACRAGPGQVYNSLGALKVGQTAQAVGRSADGKYWIILNPNRPGEVCWLWGGYATVIGVAGALPVFTPPPTPRPTRTPTRVPATHTQVPTTTNTPPATNTPPIPPPIPSFTASYSGMDSCTGSTGTERWVDITLTNNGQVSFQSMALVLQDRVSSDVFSLASDDFIDKNGCGVDTLDILSPGVIHIVSSPALAYDPTGHELFVTIALCSGPGQTGACVTQVLDFTP